MKSGTAKLAIVSAALVATIALVMLPMITLGSSKYLIPIALAGVIGLGLLLGYRYLTTKKQAQLELAGGEQYRQLAEEYRRLADLAITAQEHTDLKLGEVSVQLDYLRTQNEALQRILKEVE
jgi:uncharacterized membrane protein